MPLYRIPSTDGEHKVTVSEPVVAGHVLAIAPEPLGSAGTVTVKARAAGCSEFENIPDGDIDLSASKSLVFSFAVAEYSFTVSGADAADFLYVTDIQGDL